MSNLVSTENGDHSPVCHLGTVRNKPLKPNQPPTLSATGNEQGLK